MLATTLGTTLSLDLRRNLWRQSGLLLILLAVGAGLALLPLAWAVLALVGGLLAWLILVRPWIGLYLLIPLIPFSSLFEISLGGVTVGAMEGLLGFVLGAWLLEMLAQRDVRLPHPPLLWPFLGFLGAVGLSWLVALSAGASLKETLKWLEMLALYLFVVARLPRRGLSWLVAMILLAGLGQAVLGLYQFVFKVGPEGFLLFGGRFLRAYGTFRQPNPYAGYLGLVLPLALSLALWRLEIGDWRAMSVSNLRSRTPALRPVLRQLAILGGLLLLLGTLVAALFASQSRGAWLGFVVAASVTVAARSARAALWFGLLALLGGGLGLLGAFQLLPASLVQRFSEAFGVPIGDAAALAMVEVTDANFAAVERLAHWQAAIDMWRDHLWLGVGFGNYAAVYPAYAVGRWLDPLGHAHNYFLNAGAETGLLGLLAYLGFWVWAVALAWRAIRRSRQRSEPLQVALAAGSLGIIAHLHVHNLFDNLFVQGMYLHLALILGLITLIDRPAANQS